MKSLDIKVLDRIARVNLLKRNKNRLTVMVDNKKYDVDIEEVGNGIYSILNRNRSYNVELIENKNAKSYIANTFYQNFEMEVQDAESRYLQNRNSTDAFAENKMITSPMPGRIVKVLVSVGETIAAGQTVIIVSAMKMESEYKAQAESVVKEILVKEGDIVSANQPLIIFG